MAAPLLAGLCMVSPSQSNLRCSAEQLTMPVSPFLCIPRFPSLMCDWAMLLCLGSTLGSPGLLCGRITERAFLKFLLGAAPQLLGDFLPHTKTSFHLMPREGLHGPRTVSSDLQLQAPTGAGARS